MKKTISIGIPCFNEEVNVPLAYKALTQVCSTLKQYSFEYIFVDNGSTDATRAEIRKLIRKNKQVKGVFLSRNFGPEASGQAALDYAGGDAFIFYECDMQDPAELIKSFVERWEAGFDVVVGVRTKIQDTFPMAVLRKSFYRIFKAFSNIDVPVNAGSFCLMSRRVVTAMNSLPEKYRFHRGLRAWVGFKVTYIQYERRKREHGRSSYNVLGYLRHAERSILGFSYFPLDLIVTVGLLIVGLSFSLLFFYVLYSIFFQQGHIDQTTIIVGAVVLLGGVQLLAISFVGKYIQVIVEETKARPLYIVEEIEKN